MIDTPVFADAAVIGLDDWVPSICVGLEAQRVATMIRLKYCMERNHVLDDEIGIRQELGDG